MNVTSENLNNGTAIITVALQESDYQDKVKKDLKHIAATHDEPGFRKGKVPFAIVNKKYGKHVLADVVNREIQEGLFNYVRDNKVQILGEPMPVEGQNIDIENDKDFTFKFEVGLNPEMNVTVDKSVKLPFYKIEVSDEMMKNQDESLRRRFGAQVPVQEMTKEAVVKGVMVEVDANGNAIEGGITVASAVVSPERFVSEDEKAKFAGKKLNDKVIFNPWNTCNGNVVELASMLNIEKSAATDVHSDFEFAISEIIGLQPAELGTELYDNVFGKDVVKTEEEYFAKMKEMIAGQLIGDSNYRFTLDCRESLVSQVESVSLPDDFLKRWLMTQNESHKPENIDEEYANMIPALKWQLVKENVMKANSLSINDDDLKAIAKATAANQFAQYGITNMGDDILEKYAGEMLGNKETKQQLIDHAVEEKLFNFIKENVTIEEKTVTADEFNALFTATK